MNPRLPTPRLVVLQLLLAVLLTMLPVVGRAQAELAGASVLVWPEYDQPAVLVILEVTIAPDVPLPTVARLAIPEGVMPHAVAKRGPDGSLFLAEYQISTDGMWQVLDITTESPVVRVEYYAELDFEDQTRRFSFTWNALTTLGALGYEVMVPFGATGVFLDPAPTNEIVKSDGRTYLQAVLGGVPQGENRTFSLTYIKETETLTVAPAPALSPPAEPRAETPPPMVPIAPVDVSEPAAGSGWDMALYAVIIAAIVLVLGMFFYPQGNEEDA